MTWYHASGYCILNGRDISLNYHFFEHESRADLTPIYIADLRATFQMDLDLKIFRMNRLRLPQERMANRLGVLQQTISLHLQEMAALPKLVNTDLSKGFTVPQVAEKHGWAEPLVWSIALEGKSDLE